MLLRRLKCPATRWKTVWHPLVKSAVTLCNIADMMTVMRMMMREIRQQNYYQVMSRINQMMMMMICKYSYRIDALTWRVKEFKNYEIK